MSEPEHIVFPCQRLEEFSKRVFMHFEVPEADASLAAEVLAASDLRGIDSHGVARLHAYFEMLSAGRINPRPALSIQRDAAFSWASALKCIPFSVHPRGPPVNKSTKTSLRSLAISRIFPT